jgi:NAD(P)-dependent dehydrogenase (short-subunit alcohol dehydrogenase family)
VCYCVKLLLLLGGVSAFAADSVPAGARWSMSGTARLQKCLAALPPFTFCLITPACMQSHTGSFCLHITYCSLSAGRPRAVVTGANKGIGFEICRQLLGAGVSVVVTGRSLERGEEATSRLRREPNGHLVLGFVEMDVADNDSVAQSVPRISDLVEGELDLLVNNAGVGYPDRLFGAAEAHDIVNVNTYGTMRATRALLPLLSRACAGRIVNVASIESSLAQLARPLQQRFTDAALNDTKLVALIDEFVASVAAGSHRRDGWGGTMYHASKVGQMAFAAVLARELTAAQSNVTVVSCCPGFCRTDMSDQCYGVGLGHKSAAEGADTSVWLAVMAPEEARASHGCFFSDRRKLRW